MFFEQIHRFFSFSRLLKFLVGIALLVQLVVISYNHLTGYYILDGFQHFLLRFLRGFLLSLAAGFLIAYPDLYVIRSLNKKLPWGSNTIQRVALELSLALGIAVIVSVLITLFANWVKPYEEDLWSVLVSNAQIYAVVNAMIVAVLEGWIFFIESREARQKAEHLEKELSQIKFEVLKSQINPHFMFNSLNVLSGLIDVDTEKAQQFIDEFSQIYRYVLDTIEQPVARLNQELEFMRSYLFLQQMRYGKNLTWSVNIPAELLQSAIPPLSLQVVLENAIKHNIVNEAKPLHIEVFSENNHLIIKNNIQLKVGTRSSGLGQKNLLKRYAFISNSAPVFQIINNDYIAKLPLIKIEDDEGTDY